jgi:hypothetical protein
MSSEFTSISAESKQERTSEVSVLAIEYESTFLKYMSRALISIDTYDVDILIFGLMEVFQDLDYSRRKVYELLLIKCGSSIDTRFGERKFIIKKLMELYKDLHYDQNTIQYLLYQKYDICIKCQRKCWYKDELCAIHGQQLKTCLCCCSVNDMEEDDDTDNSK